jgi:hypothetical protein
VDAERFAFVRLDGNDDSFDKLHQEHHFANTCHDNGLQHPLTVMLRLRQQRRKSGIDVVTRADLMFSGPWRINGGICDGVR